MLISSVRCHPHTVSPSRQSVAAGGRPAGCRPHPPQPQPTISPPCTIVRGPRSYVRRAIG